MYVYIYRMRGAYNKQAHGPSSEGAPEAQAVQWSMIMPLLAELGAAAQDVLLGLLIPHQDPNKGLLGAP